MVESSEIEPKSAERQRVAGGGGEKGWPHALATRLKTAGDLRN